MNKCIVFDIKGNMGHFRMVDTNSSSLTYGFPPRTTLTGLVACILGYEKNTYHTLFSSDKCKIAVQVLEPVRKVVHVINYKMTKRNRGVHTQVPVQFVMGKENKLCYRIFFLHDDDTIMESLRNKLQEKSYVYPVSLGITECLADCTYIGEAVCSEKTGQASVTSIIDMSMVTNLKLSDNIEDDLCYNVHEMVPVQFNDDRILTKNASYIYEEKGQAINGNFKRYYKVKYNDTTENIIFL